MPPLSMMIKPVSAACAMRCRYCFYADVSGRRAVKSYGTMSRDTMRALVRRAFAYADGAVSFAFQGGEPTLAGVGFYREFVDLARQYNARNLRVSYALQTNGYELSDELCAFFAENRFLLGVSVDGTREIHDALRQDARGEGTYDRVMQSVARLRRHGVDYNVLCVVTEPVARQGAACWDALSEHKYLQFIPCIDDFDGERREYSLTAASYGQFLIDTFDRYEAAFYAGRPVSERRLDNYLMLLLGRRPEHCGMAGPCGLYFLVEADGGVYPCDFYVLDEWRLGNVNESGLRRMESCERARAFRAMSLERGEKCATCPWFGLCRGGCRRDREPWQNGMPSENRFCESYRRFFEARLPRLEKLARAVEKGKS